MSELERAKLEKEVTDSRRDFLKKAGKLAVYTPPAMLVLMKPSYAGIGESLSESHNPTRCGGDDGGVVC